MEPLAGMGEYPSSFRKQQGPPHALSLGEKVPRFSCWLVKGWSGRPDELS